MIFISFLLLLDAQAAGRCDPDFCYTRQTPETRQLVLDGQTIVIAQGDMLYAFKRVRGADPELVAGIFASIEEQPGNIDALKSAEVIRRDRNTTVARYELDVKKLIGFDAPNSRYAVTNYHEKRGDGDFLIWWEIDPAETAKLNPRKGLLGRLTGNLGEPEYIHGFIRVEAIPGTTDSIVTYANYVVPKSAMARAAAGMFSKTSRTVIGAFVERVAGWAERVAAGSPQSQANYRARICELLLK